MNRGKYENKAWLDAGNVAKIIIDAIQRSQEKVMIPKGFELMILLRR
jgi:hypothetical protein